MEFADYPQEAQDKIRFLERTVYEALSQVEYQDMDFEALVRYLKERFTEYGERWEQWT